jgi:hypothetical protein
MLGIGAVFGGPELTGMPIDRCVSQLMEAVSAETASFPRGSGWALNVVFHVPGRKLPDIGYEGLRDGTFSRRQRMLMIQVAVPHEVVACENEEMVKAFLVDSLRQANKLAARYFKKRSIAWSQPKLLDIVNAVEARLASEAEWDRGGESPGRMPLSQEESTLVTSGVAKRLQPLIRVDVLTYGSELERSAITKAVQLVMAAARKETSNVAAPDVPGLCVVFHVPGSQGRPRWDGLAHAALSRRPPLLMVKVAVPETIACSDSSIDFVVESLRGANTIGFHFFSEQGMSFPLERAEALVNRISQRAIELGAK